MRRVAPKHILYVHGVTTQEYRERFPDAPLVTDEWRLAHGAKLLGRPVNRTRHKPRKGATKDCEVCGRSYYVRPYLATTAKFCSRTCQRKGRIMGGPAAHNWKGGYDPYYGPNWPRQRRAARLRDGYTCQSCGAIEAGIEHDVHHIQPFRLFGRDRYQDANRLHNLVTLCHRCHAQVTNGGLIWPPIAPSA